MLVEIAQAMQPAHDRDLEGERSDQKHPRDHVDGGEIIV
jgi:hypothetical protein